MSTYDDKINLIIQNIKKNGKREIDGDLLQSVLTGMLDENAATVDGVSVEGNTYTKDQTDNLTAVKYIADDSIAVDILQRTDYTSGVEFNYREETLWYDGTPLTDARCDDKIFYKKNNKYWRKTIPEDFIPKVDNITSLRAFNAYFEGQEIILLGYYAPGDKNILRYKFTVINYNTLVDDGGSIIKTDRGVWIAQFNNQIDVKDFGAVGDGVTDDTDAIQKAFNSNGIKNIEFDSNVYVSNSMLQLPVGKNIIGKNATIKTQDGITLLSLLGNNIVENLTLESSGYATVNSSSIAISAKGADSSNYIEDITLNNISINSFGFYGILNTFCKNINISNININGVGYAGYMGFSVENVNILNGNIKNITGSGSLGYGIAFTRSGLDSSLVTYPRSKNCYVDNITVENNPTWEAFDTHGGDNIVFKNCNYNNCKVGYAIVSSHLNNVDDHAPINCKVINCKGTGSGTGSGIVVSGAMNTNNSLEPIEYASNCVVINNELHNVGEVGNNISGGIRIMGTVNCIVENNIITEPRDIGINIYVWNNFKVSNNIIVDAYSETNPNASCIALRGNNNKGDITNNTTLRVNTSLGTYVSTRGVTLITDVTNVINLSLGYNTAILACNESFGENTRYLTLGNNAYLLTSNGTPEGVVTAPRGAICINKSGSGSYGSTFYFKEIGSGNTGWRTLLPPNATTSTNGIIKLATSLIDTNTTDAVSPANVYQIFSSIYPQIKTVSDLRLFNGKEGDIIELLGYYTSGDKPSVRYKYTLLNFGTLVDDGGSVIKTTSGSWIAQFNKEISVKDFGLIDDGSTDNSPYLIKLNTYLSNIAPTSEINRFKLIFPFSNNYYKSTTGLTVPAFIDLQMDGVLLYSGTPDITVITVGDNSKLNVKTNLKINVRSETVSWVNPTYVGFKLINLQSSTNIEIVQSIGFNTGGIFTGNNSSGFVYNLIRLGQIANNKIDLKLTNSSNGWINENIFEGGRFQRVSSVNPTEDKYGIIITSDDGVYVNNNNNNFYKPSFEFNYSGTGDTVPVVIEHGVQNNFKDVRFESGEVPCAIRTLNASTDNVFEIGYLGVSSFVNSRLAQDNGLYPNTRTISRKNGIRQSGNKYLVYNSDYLPKKLFSKNGTHVYAPNEMFIVTSGSASNSKNSTAITINSDSITLATSLGVGVRVDSSKNKRFVINKYIKTGGNPGRIAIRCYNSSGVILTNDKVYVKGEATAIPVYSTGYGGCYRLGSDADTNMYINLHNDVAYIDVLITGATNPCDLVSFSVEALDFPTSIIDSYNKKGWYASEAPTTTAYETGTIVYSTVYTNKLLGWVYTGSAWIELLPKNEAGQVKVNYSGLQIVNFTANTYKQFDVGTATPTVVASPTTRYPNSTPKSYLGVFDSSRNGGTTTYAGRLIENPVQGQVHRWRIQGSYSGKSVTPPNTEMIYVKLRNPVSSFEVIWNIAIPPNQNSGNFTIDFLTISDNASIPSPNGYIIEAMYTATDSTLTINFSSITRVSEAYEA